MATTGAFTPWMMNPLPPSVPERTGAFTPWMTAPLGGGPVPEQQRVPEPQAVTPAIAPTPPSESFDPSAVTQGPVQGPPAPDQSVPFQQMTPEKPPEQTTPDSLTSQMHQQTWAGLQKNNERDAAIKRMQENIQTAEKSQSNTWPTIIAWAALLQGNAGPMMSLQEQKRKTAIGKTIYQTSSTISDLMNKGDFEGAQQAVTAAAGEYGQRTPELVQFFTQMGKQIAEKQSNLQQTQFVYNAYKNTPGMTDTDPAAGGLMKAMKYSIDHNVPIDAGTLNNAMTRLAAHQQIVDHALNISGIGGAMKTIPIQQVLSVSHVNTPAGLALSAAHGISANDMANLINGMQVKDSQGNVIAPDSQQGQLIRHQFTTQAQAINAQLEISKLLPIPPEFIMWALKNGMNPLDAATRQGYTNPDMVEKATRDYYNKITEAEVSKNIGIMESDPFALGRAGYEVVNLSGGLDTFGNSVNVPMPYASVRADPRLGALPRDIVRERLQPAIFAIKGLDDIASFNTALGSPDTWAKQLGVGLTRYASDLLGRDLKPGISAAKAAELFVERSLEHAQNVLKLGANTPDNRVVEQLKRYVVGKMNNPEEAAKAVEHVRTRLLEVIKQSTGRMVEENRPNVVSPGGAPAQGGARPRPQPQGGTQQQRNETGLRLQDLQNNPAAVDYYQRYYGLGPYAPNLQQAPTTVAPTAPAAPVAPSVPTAPTAPSAPKKNLKLGW